MLFFHLQALYNIFVLIFTWFNLANAYLTFSVVIDLLASERQIFGAATDDINISMFFNLALLIIVVNYIYVAFVVLQFILALGNRPKSSKWLYITSFVVFAIIQ